MLSRARDLRVERIALVGVGLAAHIFDGEARSIWDEQPRRNDALPLVLEYRSRLFSAAPNTVQSKVRNTLRHVRGLEDSGQALLYFLGRGYRAILAAFRNFQG